MACNNLALVDALDRSLVQQWLVLRPPLSAADVLDQVHVEVLAAVPGT